METHGNVPKCIPEQDNGTETVDCSAKMYIEMKSLM